MAWKDLATFSGLVAVNRVVRGDFDILEEGWMARKILRVAGPRRKLLNILLETRWSGKERRKLAERNDHDQPDSRGDW